MFTWHFYGLEVPVIHLIKKLLLLFKLLLASWNINLPETITTVWSMTSEQCRCLMLYVHACSHTHTHTHTHARAHTHIHSLTHSHTSGKWVNILITILTRDLFRWRRTKYWRCFVLPVCVPQFPSPFHLSHQQTDQKRLLEGLFQSAMNQGTSLICDTTGKVKGTWFGVKDTCPASCMGHIL